MKNFVTLLLAIFCFCSARAKVFYHLRLEISNTHISGQDSVIQFRIVMSNKGIVKSDSFTIDGDYIFDKNYEFEDGFRFDDIHFIACNRFGDTLRYYEPGGGFSKELCTGYYSYRPLSGQACSDLGEFGLGIICAKLQFNFVVEGNEDSILSNANRLSDPMRIYKAFDTTDSDSLLLLSMPCYFAYRNASSSVKWYESQNGLSDWRLVDSGWGYYPAKSGKYSYKLFNQTMYYKAVVDTNYVKHHQVGYSSDIFGPVRFYLNERSDSLVLTKNRYCYDKNKLNLYFDTAVFLIDTSLPELFVFYKANDSTPEEKWYLGRIHESPTDIIGHRVFSFQGEVPKLTKVPYRKGRYRVFCDFTPWNSRNLNRIFDTCVADDSDSGYFNAAAKMVKEIECYGEATGQLRIAVSGDDTSEFKVSMNGTDFFDTSRIFTGLNSGYHKIYVVKDSTCHYSGGVFVKSPEKFSNPLSGDTTLCIGQNLFLAATHNNAVGYTWTRLSDTISRKDTITLADEGTYLLVRKNAQQCVAIDSIKIARKNLRVTHDFFIPSQCFLADTVMAVMCSKPLPDKWRWGFDSHAAGFDKQEKWSVGINFSDTGSKQISLFANYGECGFYLQKKIQVLGASDSGRADKRLGLLGPLIRAFGVSPNPNDGEHFKLSLVLRDTAVAQLYKLDPVSGKKLSEVIWRGNSIYSERVFAETGALPGVYYVRVVAGNESRLLKVVVTQ